MKNNILYSVLLSHYSTEHLRNITEDGKTDLCHLYTATLLTSSKMLDITGGNLVFIWFLCEQISQGKISFPLLTIRQEIQQWIHDIQPDEIAKQIPFPIPTLEEIYFFIESTPALFQQLAKPFVMIPFYVDLEKHVLFPQRTFLMCKEILQEISVRNCNNLNISKNWEEIYSFLEKYKDPIIKIEQREIDVYKSFLQHNITFLTGGPGTGKTTCIFICLSSLLFSQESEIKTIFLLAPTGRAAAQLQESLSKRVIQSSQELQNIFQTTKIESSTIHAFLKISSQSSNRPSSDHPVEADVIIVDESSMLNIGMLHQLFSSTPTKTRIIFVGDPFQLPPVKEFNILWSFLESLRRKNANYLVTLEKQHRSQSHIQQLSSYLRSFQKDPEIPSNFFKSLRASESKKISYISTILSMEKILEMLRIEFQLEMLVSLSKDFTPHYSLTKEELSVLEKMFSILQNFSFLQSTKHTPLGTVAINNQCLTWLRHHADNIVYPICVTQNDHNLEIYNGDRGLYLEHNNHPEKNVVIFIDNKTKQGYQFISPSLLKLETAFSQTVHKSQGSEFKRVILFLEQASPVTTRSLIYTAITRAKDSFCLIAEEDMLQNAIENISNCDNSIFQIIEKL